jgi:hypothetical protein
MMEEGMLARLFGLLIVAAGLATGWFIVLEPLHQAAAHAPSVHYSIKGFVFVPLALVSGLALFLGGNSVVPIFLGAPRGFAQKSMAFVIMAVAFSATGAGWWLFTERLAALGYGH